MIDVQYERGIYLPRLDLWLDPWDAKRLAFISHAHSDHIAPHEEIIISEPTARFLLAKPHSLRLLQGFDKIDNDATRLAVLHLVESLIQTPARSGSAKREAVQRKRA